MEKKKVLVIDDDRIVLESVKKVLAADHYDPDSAGGPVQCIREDPRIDHDLCPQPGQRIGCVQRYHSNRWRGRLDRPGDPAAFMHVHGYDCCCNQIRAQHAW